MLVTIGTALPNFALGISYASSCYAVVVIGFRLSTNEATLTNDPLMTRCGIIAVLAGLCCFAYPLLGLLFMLPLAGLAFYMYWTFVRGAEPVPVSMEGKVVIVTGANSGIGLEAARGLAEMGAHVVMACRTPARAEPAVADVIKTTANRWVGQTTRKQNYTGTSHTHTQERRVHGIGPVIV
jgi:hypothetical protein